MSKQDFQDIAVSVTSAGLHTLIPGIIRSDVNCSTAWCVGPSSPRPIESCVKTLITGRCIRADILIAFLAYSENIKNVLAYGLNPPCK